MDNCGKQYCEIEKDIFQVALDIGSEKIFYFKNMKRLVIEISSGSCVIDCSTPITEEDIRKIISEMKKFLREEVIIMKKVGKK